MRLPTPERLALARMRGAIDRVDDGLIVLLAARRRLVRVVAALKPRAGVAPRDPTRERQVRARAIAGTSAGSSGTHGQRRAGSGHR